MKRLFVIVLSTTLLTLGLSVATVSTASAAYVSTNPPAYDNGTTADPQSIGHIRFYDASGNQIIGGSLSNLGGAIYAVSDQTPRANATKATLSVAAPDHTKVSSLWASQTISGSTNFPVAAGGSVPTVVSGATGPTVTLNGTTDGNVSSFLGVAALDTTAGYQGYLQLRIKDSGPGVAAATTWATTEIAFDTTAGTWAMVFPSAPCGLPPTVNVFTTPSTQTVPSGTSASVAASASLSPSSLAGTIQFQVDGVNAGAPVAVSSGVAVATLTGLTGSPYPGTGHVVAATFTPAPSPYATVCGLNSVSTNTGPNATVIWNSPPIGTTNVALSSANITFGVDTLTATATTTDTSTPASTVNVGFVQFKVDGINSGSPVPISASGTATYVIPTGNLAASSTPGTAHVVSATYLGGGPYGPSTSSAATFNLIISFPSDLQNIQTSITPGTLIISTPYYVCSNVATSQGGSYTGTLTNGVGPANPGTNVAPCVDHPLVLPAMTLNSAATEYATSAAFTGISVADTRPGNLPYTLSAIASNLTKVGISSPGVNETINAQNVGLNVSSLTSTNASPNTFLGAQAPGASTTGQNFTGFNNAAASHVAAGAAGSAGLGGTNPHVVLHANSGLGTTVTAGTLSITAPSNTLDGTYAGTITFSIIGS